MVGAIWCNSDMSRIRSAPLKNLGVVKITVRVGIVMKLWFLIRII